MHMTDGMTISSLFALSIATITDKSINKIVQPILNKTRAYLVKKAVDGGGVTLIPLALRDASPGKTTNGR